MVKTRRDKRRKRTKRDMIRPGERYSRGFHTAETYPLGGWGAALMPECVTSLFTSSQSERTRFEVVSETIPVCTYSYRRTCAASPYIEEGWLEQYRAVQGRSDCSSRRGNVLPRSMERHAQGKGLQVLFFKSLCQTEVLDLNE